MRSSLLAPRLSLLALLSASIACTAGIAPAQSGAPRMGILPLAALSPTAVIAATATATEPASTATSVPPTDTAAALATPMPPTDTLTPAPAEPTPLGGSGRILYGSGPVDGPRDLMLLDLASGQAITLTTGGRNLNPAWFPDRFRVGSGRRSRSVRDERRRQRAGQRLADAAQ